MIGLRRSFRLAGARSVIASLWEVSDRATVELMHGFYDRLWIQKQSKLDALPGARLEILAHMRQEHAGRGLPYFWGAFVLDGAWK